MAQIPSHAQWMQETHSLTSPRSDFLKAVDQALLRYGQSSTADNRQAIKTALDRWRFEQSKQGKDWRQSTRNKKGAVTNLHRALTDLDKRKLTAEELEAMRYIARMQATALQRQFDGKELKFKASTLVGLASGTGTKWQKFKTGASALASGGATAASAANAGRKIVAGANLLQQGGRAAASAASQQSTAAIVLKVRELCAELCPGLDPNRVFQALNLGSIDQFAAELAPFVGAISSGGKAIIGWIGVIRQQYGEYRVLDARHAIAPGDPEAAFDALAALLDREIASAIARASVKTGAFTAKTAGVFADAGAVTGPVVGLLEVLAEIIQSVIEYVRDYKECETATEMLRVGALNLDLFSACPILGCYFLVIQDHSTVINFAVGDYGTENWMFDVERLVKKVEVVLEKSRELIRQSRLEIPGMTGAKGLVEENYSVKTGLGKVTGLPGHVVDQVTGRLEEWFGNPVRPPAVDTARIRGISNAKWRA
jgi:hypothetical protein